MSDSSFKILVSGGGIAGNCLAYWLARTKLRPSITVIERSPVPRVTGQAVDIHPGPGVDVVTKMGLLDAIREFNTTETGTLLLKSSGRPFLHLPKEGTISFTNEHEILRADLAQIFSDAATKSPSVKHIYGDTIESISQTDQSVTAVFKNGSTETHDLLVAADGAASKLRSIILDPSVAEGSVNFLGQYSAFYSIPRIASDDKLWHWYNTDKGRCIMIRPHRNDKTVGVYLSIVTPGHGIRDPVIDEAIEKGPDASKKALREYFTNAGWQAERVLDGMDLADDFYISPATQVILPKWTNGRCALAGDAGWATFGVGTTLAIVGAYHLAGAISRINSPTEVPKALQIYEEEFRPLYKKMQDLPPGYPQMLFPQSHTGLWIRNWCLWLVGYGSKIPGVSKLVYGDMDENWKMPEFEWVEPETRP